MRARTRSLPLSLKMVGVALMLFLTLVPLLVAGFISQENTRQTLLDEKRSDLRANAEEVINSIDRILEVRLEEVVAIASDPIVVTYLANGAADPQAMEAVMGRYRSYLSMRTDIKALSLISAADGNVALSTSAIQGKYLGNRPFFKSALAGAPYASPPSRDGGASFVYYSAPVKDSTGRILAVLVMSTDAEDIWQELHKEPGQLGKGWNVVLSDKNGVRIGSSSGQSLLYKSWAPLSEQTRLNLVQEQDYGADVTDIGSTDVPQVEQLMADPELSSNNIQFRLTPDGETYEAGMDRSHINEWSAVEMLPRSAFLAGADSMRLWMSIIIGITGALIALLTLFISRMALKPINQLVNSVQNMTDGDLTTPVPDMSDREMSVLAQRFDTLRQRLLESFSELQQGYIDLAKALVASMEARDPYTAGHTERVAQYVLPLARKLDLSDADVEMIKRAAELHDIGKVAVPDSVLLKTERLTPNEAIEIKRHPTKGGEIVRYLGFLREVIPMIEGHHERYDGKGYPRGIRGENIALGARILAVVDSYDAMTSTRAYRNALSHDRAAEILEQGAGSQWDPLVVTAFLDILREEHQLGDEESGFLRTRYSL